MLGVQVLHDQFVAADIPKQAKQMADKLNWVV
jgi:hypothetical protein